MNKICCVFNYAPHYRKAIYLLMEKELPCDFYFGDAIAAKIKKMDYSLFERGAKELSYHRLFGHFNWLKGSLLLLIKPFDHYIYTGEPYCLSTWVSLIWIKFTRKKAFLWSHGWYGDESWFKRQLKRAFFALADGTFLYGNHARKMMLAEGMPARKLHLIYNSLDYENQLQLRQKVKSSKSPYEAHFDNSRPVLIFVGRLTAEVRNYMIRTIRKRLASTVIYQSQFVEDWWAEKGKVKVAEQIIHNGVDLTVFTPDQRYVEQPIHLLCLEGHLDYSPYAIELMNQLSVRLKAKGILTEVRAHGGFQKGERPDSLLDTINYQGKLSKAELPQAYRNTIYLSLDVNAACPNTVIEALACGAPVVGFATGALRELVPPSAGIVVPYGSDPWKLGFPDVDALVTAISKVKDNWQEYSNGARAIAEERYNLNDITSQYLTVIEKAINQHI